MLSKPECGWVDITIGEFNSRASYLTHVAIDLLDAFINILKTGNVSSVTCDAEGYEYIIVVGHHSTYVILEDEDCNTKLFYHDVSKIELAQECYDDIFNSLEDWSSFSFTIEDQKKDKKKITKKLKELKRLIK